MGLAFRSEGLLLSWAGDLEGGPALQQLKAKPGPWWGRGGERRGTHLALGASNWLQLTPVSVASSKTLQNGL